MTTEYENAQPTNMLTHSKYKKILVKFTSDSDIMSCSD